MVKIVRHKRKLNRGDIFFVLNNKKVVANYDSIICNFPVSKFFSASYKEINSVCNKSDGRCIFKVKPYNGYESVLPYFNDYVILKYEKYSMLCKITSKILMNETIIISSSDDIADINPLFSFDIFYLSEDGKFSLFFSRNLGYIFVLEHSTSNMYKVETSCISDVCSVLKCTRVGEYIFFNFLGKNIEHLANIISLKNSKVIFDNNLNEWIGDIKEVEEELYIITERNKLFTKNKTIIEEGKVRLQFHPSKPFVFLKYAGNIGMVKVEDGSVLINPRFKEIVEHKSKNKFEAGGEEFIFN